MWNALRFTALHFSLLPLLQTLFFPWKRDVSFRAWRGFHPLKFFGLAFNNIFSRFWGAMVRLVVLMFGVLIFCVVFLFGGMFFLLFCFGPLLLGSSVVLYIFSSSLGFWFSLFGFFGCLIAFLGYVMREKDIVPVFDIRVLRRKSFFKRILARLGLHHVETAHLENDASFSEFLQKNTLERTLFEKAVLIEWAAAVKRSRKKKFWLWDNLKKTRPIGKGWCYAYTPKLDQYVVDLSSHDPTEYREMELVGRREEFSVTALVLKRPVENNVVIVGDPGIGKKTLVHYFGRSLRENVFRGDRLGDARLLLFDIGAAISDAVGHGQDPEYFLRTLFLEAAYAGNVILVIENIDTHFSGNGMHSYLPSLFTEFLQLPTFRVIATASTNQYHELIKKEAQAFKFFETVYIREPNEAETFDILLHFFEESERQNVVFTIQGLEAIIAFASRYHWETPFPERAIDLAQEILLYWQGTDDQYITPGVAHAFFSLKTGASTGAAEGEEREKLLHLEELLHERVIGQTEAVREVAEAMRKARVGFSDPKRPLGSFIFFGPSGVGKTETAKAFAESYFGDEKKMIRFDMSEFQTPQSIDRMIGSRITNVQGELVNAAKEKPFSILLLDEIEKAYPRVLDLFLQILDEGYVTDGFGEKVSFRNMIIIATSNAGAPLIKSLVAEQASMVEIRKQVLDHIIEKNIFRLEFLSRFNGLIFFEPLKQTELEAVAMLKLQHFADRLKKEKNITVVFDSDVASLVVERGFEAEFGTRSLNRFIENAIEDVMVKKIIAGEVTEGSVFRVSGNEL